MVHQIAKLPGRLPSLAQPSGRTLSLELIHPRSAGDSLGLDRKQMHHQLIFNGRDHLKWDRVSPVSHHFGVNLASLFLREPSKAVLEIAGSSLPALPLLKSLRESNQFS